MRNWLWLPHLHAPAAINRPAWILTVLACCGVSAVHAQTWKVQFNYDKDASSLEIHDFHCPSAKVCVAAGAIINTAKDQDKIEGTVVLTSDGGAHWSFEPVKEVPESIFFLNDSIGWMVTEKGVWQSTEAGHDWKKLKGMKGLTRIWFTDETHGWAVGAPKAIYQSSDGGKEWTRSPASDLTKFPADLTTYDWITFSGKRGLISGSIAPENVNFRRGPSAAVFLESQDAGQTWKSTAIEMEGRISCLRFEDNLPSALGVVEYFGKAEYPAEVFQLNLDKRSVKPTFDQKDKVARDVAILPNGDVIVAAVERIGELSEVPIPSKLKIMNTTSLQTWLPEKVDYRAVAMRPILAFADSNNVWVATDTGMILKRSE